MEYALDLQPVPSASSGLPAVIVENGVAEFTYLRAAPELSYVVQFSSTLDGWTSDGVDQESNVDGAMVTATVPIGDSAKLYLRLAVQEPP